MAGTEDLDVPAINLGRRLAIREDDAVGDIRMLLDIDGDETDETDEAVVAVVEWQDDHTWSVVVIGDYEFGSPKTCH